ncbi:hypothetical protein GUJ93_ZPchr0004g38109 [Zizania palustris]|uniref:Uncharacterized protein n=1 Tax=Zizania palustris TaxID=103762 RepID=A0A8J5SC54_ZIZPA|nr:hypothetical protein GUJ93_ZPchr0004g38109 [Zizania palustris]
MKLASWSKLKSRTADNLLNDKIMHRVGIEQSEKHNAIKQYAHLHGISWYESR